MKPTKLYSCDEMAALLGVSKRSFMEWKAKKMIPPHTHVIAKHHKYDEATASAIIACFATNNQTTTSSSERVQANTAHDYTPHARHAMHGQAAPLSHQG